MADSSAAPATRATVGAIVVMFAAPRESAAAVFDNGVDEWGIEESVDYTQTS